MKSDWLGEDRFGSGTLGDRIADYCLPGLRFRNYQEAKKEMPRTVNCGLFYRMGTCPNLNAVTLPSTVSVGDGMPTGS